MPLRQNGGSANLDILRSIAVLLVLADHLSVVTGLSSRSADYYVLGRLGVLMFFVHTSLVLVMSLDRSRFSGRPIEVLSFYLRRAFRIYPLSLVCVATVIVAGVPFMPLSVPVPMTGTVVAANLLLIQNLMLSTSVIGPLWSLPLELQMYLCLPFLYLLARRFGVRGILGVECGAMLLFKAQRWATDNGIRGLGTWRLSVLEFVPCFLAGVLAYAILSRKAASERRPFAGIWWLPSLAVVVSTYILVCVLWPTPLHSPPREWAVCLAVGVLIPQFSEIQVRWLSKAAAAIAQYSYGIYLWQVAALWAGFRLCGHYVPAVRGVVSAAVLAILSWGSFHLVERPAIRLGVRLANRLARRPAQL